MSTADRITSRPCFECGAPAQSVHHVIPRSRGGERTVDLCAECHAKAHHHDGKMTGSAITRDALAAAKARGVKLGASRPECRNLNDQARRKGRLAAMENRRIRALEFALDILPLAGTLRSAGVTFQGIADALNLLGRTTPRGKSWTPTQVKRVIDRNV